MVPEGLDEQIYKCVNKAKFERGGAEWCNYNYIINVENVQSGPVY